MRREKRRADAANKVFRQLEQLRQKKQRKMNSPPGGVASHDGGDGPAIGEQEGMERQVAGSLSASER